MPQVEVSDIGDRFWSARVDHLGDQPDDVTKEQLEQQARNIDLEGASDMSKEELESTLEDEAQR